MSKQPTTQSSILPLVAAVLTLFVVIGAIAVASLDLIETARGREIEAAAKIPLTLPLVSLGLLLIAGGWLYWLFTRYGRRHMLTIFVSVATALLFIITPLLAFQAFTSERNLTVISMTCDAEALRSSGGMALAGCEDNSVDTIVLLGGVQSDDSWAPDNTVNNLTREFHDLPGGDWKAMLTVDGPPDTVAVSLTGTRDGEDVRLGTFRPHMDAESGRLRWTSLVELDADMETVRIQFFLSANPAVASASIQFQVMQCQNQSIRSFDASQCEPMESNAPFVMEKTPSEVRTWRHPLVVRDGSMMVISNLETRTYKLQPDYAGIEMQTQSTDVLVIPTAMDQTEANSVVVPGESVFDVAIEPSTGVLIYTIYVFPAGPTFAGVSRLEQ